MSDNKKPLIIITGPTAVGKTELSIALAKRIGGEIISADSMQVYRHMDIGTAKIMPDEMQGVKHYLIDELEPDEEFNVTIFKQKCDRYIEEIYSHGNIPIIVGGTGFYIQAVLYDIDFTKTETDDAYRKELQKFADEYRLSRKALCRHISFLLTSPLFGRQERVTDLLLAAGLYRPMRGLYHGVRPGKTDAKNAE